MNTLASGARPATPVWPALWRRGAPLAWPLGGIAVMLFVWWLGGLYLAGDPDTLMFANFAPGPTFAARANAAAAASSRRNLLPS